MDVLIIESDAALATSVAEALRAGGFEASIHADGETAIEEARRAPPRVLVLALELGDRPSAGFTWCNRFKRDEQLREIPLVLVSSLASDETFAQHSRLRTRADAYLRKPFAVDELLGTIGGWLPAPASPDGSDERLADDALSIDVQPPSGEISDLRREKLAFLDHESLADATPGPEEAIDPLEATAGPEGERHGDPAAGAPEPQAEPIDPLEATAGPEDEPLAAISIEPVDASWSGADGAGLGARLPPGDEPLATADTPPRPDPGDERLDELFSDLADLEEAAAPLEEAPARPTPPQPAFDAAAVAGELATARAVEAAMRVRIEAMQAELQNALDRLSAAERDLEDRAAQVARLREEWERTAADLEAAAAERDRMREELDAAVTARQLLQQELDATASENERLQAEIEDLRRELERSRRDRERLAGEVAVLRRSRLLQAERLRAAVEELRRLVEEGAEAPSADADLPDLEIDAEPEAAAG